MAHVTNVGTNETNTYLDALEYGGWVWSDTDVWKAHVTIRYFFSGSNWFPAETTAYVNALQSWANVANITIEQTFNQSSADLIEHDVAQSYFGDTTTYGQHDTPMEVRDAPSYAHGYFSYEGFGWDEGGGGGLEIGGNGYWTLIHELGHALGLKHPHDDGPGDAPLFPGVTADSDTGTNGQNNGVWTVMSYVALQDPTKATTEYNGSDTWTSGGSEVGNYGYFAGPMAYDIAAIQDLYGANTNFHNSTDTYVLPDGSGVGTYWTCIWDTGGTDEIRYGGGGDTIISLVAATLDGSATGGGVLSYVTGVGGTSFTRVQGGYTIAKGVVIENAYGGSGKDIITGNSADNILDGGAGADSMTGGNGSDQYFVDNVGDQVNESGTGTDWVRTKLSSYTLGANIENLDYNGPSGTSFNGKGNALPNIIQGWGGDDTLDGMGGADTMRGYAGNDTYYIDNAGDVIDEIQSSGTGDWAYVRLTSYTLGQFVENLNYVGTSTANFVGNGNASSNTIIGWSGDDRLDGLAGADTMRGLNGNDIYYVDNVGDVIDEVRDGGNGDWAYVSLTSYTLGRYVENLNYVGTVSAAFTGTGNISANIIQGYGGADKLDGLGGADLLKGYGGNDTFYVDDVGDKIGLELAGPDSDTVIVTTAITWTLNSGSEIHVELIRTSGSASSYAVNLTGNEFVQTLQGNAAGNQLNGKGGADSMYGYAGNDTYYVDNAADKVFETAANGTADTVIVLDNTSVATERFTLQTGSEVEVLRTVGSSSNYAVNLTGNDIANTLQGNAAANLLNGGGAADSMYGYAGNDTYYVDNSADKIFETAGNGTADTVIVLDNTGVARDVFVLQAGVGIEVIRTAGSSSSYAVNLTGNELTQTIQGNAAVNILDGKGGNADTMAGYGGNDIFLFDTALAGNVDRISDMNANGNDTIRLENAIFTGLKAGALAAGAYHAGTAATQADDHIIYNASNGGLFFDVDGVGGTAAVQFATLLNKPAALSAADFFVV